MTSSGAEERAVGVGFGAKLPWGDYDANVGYSYNLTRAGGILNFGGPNAQKYGAWSPDYNLTVKLAFP